MSGKIEKDNMKKKRYDRGYIKGRKKPHQEVYIKD